MKLLFDCTILSNYNSKSGHRAGLFFVALNLLRYFDKMGCDIELYCNFTEYYKITHINELKKYKIVPEFSILNRVSAFIFYILSFLPISLQPAVTILTRICTRFLYAESNKKQEYFSKFDAYFSPFTPPSKEIQKAKFTKCRMIHDIIPIIENNSRPSQHNWMLWYNQIYNTINENDLYVTNSQYTRNDVLNHFKFLKPEKIKTTLLAANSNFKPVKDNTVFTKYSLPEKYFLSLCTLGKRKNIKFAIINFFRFIKENNINDLYFVLAGGIWKAYKKELSDILSQVDASKIIILGYVEDEILPILYSKALAFVFPSLYEGFGLPPLEAMQSGCPVICSNATSLPEVTADAGILINPHSNEEIIDAYKKMYFDSNFREVCKQKGIERAKKFSWEKCAKEILDFIEQNTPSK
ncbi:glycosyltransferase family 4 protein [bacterium]|nr:glycosyltransferase family 4 protein [bacterium]